MKNSIRIILAFLVLAAMVLPRVADLVEFTAADEPFWLVVGANYYYALTHREFENTVYEYHPAVTTMWIGATAMLLYFPEYRGRMNGYFQQEKTRFDEYLVEQGRDPLDLLWWARLLQVLVNLSLFIVTFFLLRSLLDEGIALAVLLLTSFAPYLFGQSRMLNHESMVGLFSVTAVLALTVYLFRERHPALLALSGASAAFANLTKSSAVVLVPVTTVLILAWGIRAWKLGDRPVVLPALKTGLAWLGMGVLVYFLAWPGMWVAPGKMLHEVYGNAFSYALLGARLSVTQELQPSQFDLDSAFGGIAGFLVSIAWRTTPVTWLGLVLALVALVHRGRETIPPQARLLIGFLLLLALACIALFAIARGRNQPHYVLAAYYGFEFAAALGWAYTFRWLGRTFSWAGKPAMQAALFAPILVLQGMGLLHTAPYFYTYLNPALLAMKEPPRFLYGERMEQAAAYLAARPDADELTALVYFGRSFSYYFPGETLLFKPVLFEDRAQLIGTLRRADYLVMYSGLHERLPLLQELTPERVLDLNGRSYVEIYRVSDIPAGFFVEGSNR
jgi:hypothetical protein